MEDPEGIETVLEGQNINIVKGSDKEKVEFVNLVKSMVELDSQFEDWKLHLDKSKTIEQVLNELRVYIDKFDKISEKLRTIAHSNMYEPYCTYPNIILDKFIR